MDGGSGRRGTGSGGCKGFGSGGVGGRGTGPRDGANFATCVVFLSKRRKMWGGGGTHRSWPGGRGGRPRTLIPGEGVREGLAWPPPQQGILQIKPFFFFLYAFKNTTHTLRNLLLPGARAPTTYTPGTEALAPPPRALAPPPWVREAG